MKRAKFKKPDTNKCDGCRFCGWDSEYQEYHCYAPWCRDGSAYVEYKGIYKDGEIKCLKR